MGAFLALASAISYGLADFAGGLLSRRAHVTTVALVGQVGGLAAAMTAALVAPLGHPNLMDLIWGATSGLGSGLAMLLLYQGMSRAAMSVVVPVSAIGGVTLPLLVSVVAWGERPPAMAWLGIGVAVPALWLVTRGRSPASSTASAGVTVALAAGAGIATQYLALAQVGPGAGLWPVAVGRVVAVLAVLPLALGEPARLRIPLRHAFGAAASGMAAAGALVFYLLATRHQLVTLAVVLSSLYPAIPVLLGITLLRERLSRLQAAGLLAAGAAVSLLTVA